MGQLPEFEENCERYLLGELSEAEQEQFEEDYFADDALFEQFQAVKDEMLDAYARGELVEEKRERFAEHFLAAAPRRREFEETREFIRAATAVSTRTVTSGNAAVSAPVSTASQKSSWQQSFKGFFSLRPFAWQTAFAAVLLIALAGVWIVVRNGRQTPTDEQAASQPTPLPTIAAPTNENSSALANNNADVTPSPTPLAENKSPANAVKSPSSTKPVTQPVRKTPTNRSVRNRQPESAKNSPPVNDRKNTGFSLTLSTVGRDPEIISSITLSPVTARGVSDENSLDIYRTTRKVRVRLIFKGDNFRRYSAAVTTVDGDLVWQKRALKANRVDGEKSVIIQFPAVLLTKQDYIVTLKGQTTSEQTETIGEYYFRIERE